MKFFLHDQRGNKKSLYKSLLECMFLIQIYIFWLICTKLDMHSVLKKSKITDYFKNFSYQPVFAHLFSTSCYGLSLYKCFFFLLQHHKKRHKNLTKNIPRVLCFYKSIKVQTHSLYFSMQSWRHSDLKMHIFHIDINTNFNYKYVNIT